MLVPTNTDPAIRNTRHASQNQTRHGRGNINLLQILSLESADFATSFPDQ